MTENRRIVLKRGGAALVAAAFLAAGAAGAAAQEGDGSADLVQRILPNPNPEVITQWAELPDDRTWGSTAGIDIGPDGHVWVYDRCGANGLDGGCAANPTVDPILKYDRHTGDLLASFGAGLFVLPHGLHVDDDGNVWVTDSQGNDEKGHQVIKFSPEGEVLMTLGVAGQPGSDPEGPPPQRAVRRHHVGADRRHLRLRWPQRPESEPARGADGAHPEVRPRRELHQAVGRDRLPAGPVPDAARD